MAIIDYKFDVYKYARKPMPVYSVLLSVLSD
jgi:hypothetical protein